MWVKLDDSFYDHPKFIGLPPATCWLWVRMLGYCNRHRTGGFVAAALVPKKQAAELVAHHLWEPAIGGYLVHDYFVYQFEGDEQAARDTRRAYRNAAGGRARAARATRSGGRFTPEAPPA